jgi:hypothetical protein
MPSEMNGPTPLLSVYALVSWPGTTLPPVFMQHVMHAVAQLVAALPYFIVEIF